MENREFQVFVLKAIRKLSWALLTGKYEVRDIEDIRREAGNALTGMGEDKDE